MSETPLLLRYKDLPDDYLTEIGRVAVEWSSLESLVELKLWDLLRASDLEVAALTAHLGLRERLHALQAVLEIHGHDPAPIGPVVSRIIDKLAPRRNQVIHWSSVFDSDSNSARLSKGQTRSGRLEIKTRSMRLEEIKAIASDIVAARSELIDGVEKMVPKRGGLLGLKPSPDRDA